MQSYHLNCEEQSILNHTNNCREKYHNYKNTQANLFVIFINLIWINVGQIGPNQYCSVFFQIKTLFRFGMVLTRLEYLLMYVSTKHSSHFNTIYNDFPP